MKRGHTLIAAATIAAATALTLTGCNSSSSDNGTAKAADASAAAAKLDTGTYPTTPQPNFGKAGSASKGTIIEGQRMAEYVVHPFDIDSSLTKMAQNSTYVIKNVDALTNIWYKSVPPSIANDHFVNGFSASASGDEVMGRSAVHAVLRFADPASAQQAAKDLHQALLTTDLNDLGLPDRTTPPDLGTEDHISALPNTLVDTHDSDGQFTLEAVTPHGPYVFYDWFQGKSGGAPGSFSDSKQWAATSVATAVQLQGPKIDAFPATPIDQFANLPIDEDGVLRLTIPPTAENVTVNNNAVYGPNGFLNFAGDPVADVTLLKKTGTDRVAMGDTNVYRAKDAQSAQMLLAGFAKQYDQGGHPGPAVPGVPGSKCWALSSVVADQTVCLIARGRYVGETRGTYMKPFDSGDSATPAKPGTPQPGSDITEAHQKAAAQYEILAGQN